MERDMIKVRSESDRTIVMSLPELGIHRTFRKRGQEFPFERETLYQAYFDPSIEYLFSHGMLTTDDEAFKENFGLVQNGKEAIYILSETQKKRMIKAMPLSEVKKELKGMNKEQIEDLVDYAIEHYTEFNLDRAELFSKASGKNILKAIDNYKSSLEG